jgi:brefeldin A-inhibited guanine nucleotide-exchange protein
VTDADGQAILPAPLSPTNNDNQRASPKTTLNDRRRVFKQIIVKCVLQLLLIETTNDLLRNDEVYRTIPPEHLLRLMGVLDHSYQFARMFNEDKELRTGLWKVGKRVAFTEPQMYVLTEWSRRVHEAPAELVKARIQQRRDPGTYSSADVLRPSAGAPNSTTAGRRASAPVSPSAQPPFVTDDFLCRLGLGVLQDYTKLKTDTQAKNIAAWTPVVAEILHGFCKFDDKAVRFFLPHLPPLFCER